MSEERMSKEDVLAQLRNEWGEFLQRLSYLDALQQDNYLKQKEYESLNDLLNYICGYWSGTLWMIPLSLISSSGAQVVQTGSIDQTTQEYFARLEVEESKNKLPDRPGDMEKKFSRGLKKFIQFVDALSEDDFSDQATYVLILNATFMLYEEHFL